MVEGTGVAVHADGPVQPRRADRGARAATGEVRAFLDCLFTSIAHPAAANADLSNEPSIEIPWEYDYVGAPWKTQQVVREAQQKLYFNAPVG